MCVLKSLTFNDERIFITAVCYSECMLYKFNIAGIHDIGFLDTQFSSNCHFYIRIVYSHKTFTMRLRTCRKIVVRSFVEFCSANLKFCRSKSCAIFCTFCLLEVRAMHRYLYRVYCLTPPTALCSDNTQNLHSSMVVWIPKSPHPSPKVNVLATHPSL